MSAPPDPVEHWMSRRQVEQLVDDGRFAEAEPLARRLVGDYSRDGHTWATLGGIQRALGQHRAAARSFDRAVEIFGGLGWYPSPSVAAAVEYLAAGDRQRALDRLHRFVFEQRSPHRAPLFDYPGLEGLRDDPAFRRIVGRFDTSGWSRTEGLRRDLDFLHDEVKSTNPVYRDRAFPPEFERLYRDLREDIPDLSDEAVFIGMQRMLATLRQGHLGLWVDETAKVPNRFLPLRFYAFSDGLFIVDASPTYAGLIGTKVEGLGELTANEALRRLADVTSHDGPMQALWFVSRLAETYYLKGLGATGAVDSLDVTLTGPGRSETVRIGTEARSLPGRQDKLPAPPRADAPLFLSRLGEMHWSVSLPEADALYVQVNNMLDDPDESLHTFGERLWADLSTTTPRTLILDLRHNNGGNTHLYTGLLRAVIAFRQVSPDSEVYAVIGRRTYSAAANFITDLERLVRPVFVGEASSECCDFHGDPRYTVLPFSGIQGELTAIKWNLSQNVFDERREMSPHIPVQMTSRDWLGGHDPALAAILEVERRRAGPVPEPAGPS